MGILNQFFGMRRGEEMLADEEKLLTLWQQHLVQARELEKLGYAFSVHRLNLPQQAEQAIQLCQKVLDAIGRELITVEHEERTDQELLDDLHRTAPLPTLLEITKRQRISFEEHYNALLDLLKHIHHSLIITMRAARALKAYAESVRHGCPLSPDANNVQQNIFDTLTGHHILAVSRFREDMISNPAKAEQMQNIAKQIICSRDLERRIVTVTDRFSEDIARHMRDPESKSKYQTLAREVIEEIAALTLLQYGDEDLLVRIEKGERMLQDPRLVEQMVRKRRRKLTDEEIAVLRDTFVRVAEEGGFVDFSDHFVR